MDKNNIQTKEYTSYSGYKEDSMLYAFRTHNDERISIVGRMSIAEAIDNLDKLGVIILFLDDGSLRKNKNVMHLYCNSLSEGDSKNFLRKFIIFSVEKNQKCILIRKKTEEFIHIYISQKKLQT